jgi:hypothetical protein
MGLKLTQFRDVPESAIASFNARMKAAKTHLRLTEKPPRNPLPASPGPSLVEEPFVAVDGSGTVRGGLILKHQDFMINGRRANIAAYRRPLSEGAINPKFAMVGFQILRQALKMQPRIYDLGMGSLNRPHSRVLIAAKWFIAEVPFYFMVVDSSEFLRNIHVLQTNRTRRFISSALTRTGLDRIALLASQLFYKRNKAAEQICSEVVAEFGPWMDDIWEEGAASFDLVAVRTQELMSCLYPSEDKRFIRLKVCSGQRPVGWAILLLTDMDRHRQFGNMRVGTIADCFSVPGFESAVSCAARDHLITHGANLIVSNQSSAAWCNALEYAGMMSGPTNFFLALSPQLMEDLGISSDGNIGKFHFNRGDGDGPVNL